MWWQRISKAINTLGNKPGGQFPAPGPDTLDAELTISSRAFFQLNRLQLNASRFLPGRAAGMRPSLRRKPASEFREHRMYVPGDDIRFVDWKASARQEHIFIKQGEHPKEATVYLLLDCSASMAWGKPSKSKTSLKLAMALGYLALSHGDRLMVVPLLPEESLDPHFRPVHPLGPVSGKGQYGELVHYLNHLPFSGQVDIAEGIKRFRRRIAAGGGLCFLLSDLLGVEDVTPALEHLPVPGWDVVICQVLHSQELAPDLNGDFEMQDIETGQSVNYDVNSKNLELYQQHLLSWQSDLEMGAVQCNAFYTVIPSHWSLEREILPHLRGLNILKPC
jgi:hypothetical protein